MKTIKLQNKIDDIVAKIFLWAFPSNFQPNWLSSFRIATVPAIWWLLVAGRIHLGFSLFIISALTDMIDGAMARKRNKITDLGKVLDPIADKLLIGTMLLFVGFNYLIVKIFLVVILLEIVANLFSSALAYRIGRPIGANIYGKIKMVLQSICVGIFFLGIFISQPRLIDFSNIILEVALFFAILAAIESTRLKWPAIKRSFKDLLHNI